MVLNLYFLTRNLEYYNEHHICTEYKIEESGLDIVKSDFVLTKETDAVEGDFLLAKFRGEREIAYFGVIEDFDNEKVECNSLLSLADIEFAATKVSGKSFEDYVRRIMNKFIRDDSTKQLSKLEIVAPTNTEHLYQPSDPPTATSMAKYLVNAFKKYNIVWRLVTLDNGKIETTLFCATEKIVIEDNIPDVTGWDVQINRAGKGSENQLLIIGKKTTDSLNPIILATYYLRSDNEITTNKNDSNVVMPTSTKISIYDTEDENKPTYDQVSSELKGNAYNHQISFQVSKDSKILDVKAMHPGLLATLIYKGKVINSVLTSKIVDSSSDKVEFTFGNIRNRVVDYLNE